MKLMLFSWQLWRLLDVVPASQHFDKLLSTKSIDARLHPILIPFVIVALCIVSIFPIILVPLGIALFCLRFSLRIAGDIARQYEAGNYTLLAVTPVGGFGMALSISRRYSAGMRGYFKDGKTFVKVIGVGLALLGLLALIPAFSNPSKLVQEFIEMLTIVALTGLVFFSLAQDYIQSAVLGVVVGMLMGSMGDRNTARVAAIAFYLGIQFASYFLLALLLALIITLSGSFSIVNRSLEFMLIALCIAFVYFGVREAVIYALWQQVLLRFNDDMPVLKIGKR